MKPDETESKPTLVIGMLLGVGVNLGGFFLLRAIGEDFFMSLLLPTVPAMIVAGFFGVRYRPWPW